MNEAVPLGSSIHAGYRTFSDFLKISLAQMEKIVHSSPMNKTQIYLLQQIFGSQSAQCRCEGGQCFVVPGSREHKAAKVLVENRIVAEVPHASGSIKLVPAISLPF